MEWVATRRPRAPWAGKDRGCPARGEAVPRFESVPIQAPAQGRKSRPRWAYGSSRRRHAPPAWEPTLPRSTALRARYRSGSRKDGLEAALRQLGAEGVAGADPIRAGRTATRRSRPLPKPRPGRCQAMELGAEAVPAAPARGIRLFLWGRIRRARGRLRVARCPAARRPDPDRAACRPRRPGGTRRANGDRPRRFPYSAGSRRPGAPVGAIQRGASAPGRTRAWLPMNIWGAAFMQLACGALRSGHPGAVRAEIGPRATPGRLAAGSQDGPPISTLSGLWSMGAAVAS